MLDSIIYFVAQYILFIYLYILVGCLFYRILKRISDIKKWHENGWSNIEIILLWPALLWWFITVNIIIVLFFSLVFISYIIIFIFYILPIKIAGIK